MLTVNANPDGLTVDSMQIGRVLERYGMEATKAWLLAKEAFCNAFLVCPTEGLYEVIRCKAGMLHTDCLGNYSTRAIPGCEIEAAIPEGFTSSHSVEGFTLPVPELVVDVNDWRLDNEDWMLGESAAVQKALGTASKGRDWTTRKIPNRQDRTYWGGPKRNRC